jgi:dolichol-phosphate mannosyltransferase
VKKIVIIPTYNEKENVENMIHTVMKFEEKFHVLIVDDNSPDGTAEIVKKLQNTYTEQLHITERAGKQGLGTAYIHGFKWALDKNYDIIFEMDCDFSHNPNDLSRLMQPIIEGKAKLTIGSRYTKGGKVENWPIGRWMMSFFASLYVRCILWLNIKDTTAGFICYHADVLRAIKLDNIPFKGYAFQICMKYAAKKKKFICQEVPIKFIDRLAGVSKMNTSIFKEAIYGVWQMKKLDL